MPSGHSTLLPQRPPVHPWVSMPQLVPLLLLLPLLLLAALAAPVEALADRQAPGSNGAYGTPQLRGGQVLALPQLPPMPLSHLWWPAWDKAAAGADAAAVPQDFNPPPLPTIGADADATSLASLLQDHVAQAPTSRARAGGVTGAAVSPAGGAVVSIPLERGVVGSRRQAALLLQLRLAQMGLHHDELSDNADHPHVSVLLEMASATTPTGVNVPLANQLLQQKRLATYFGEISIDSQRFKVLFDTGSCEFWVPAASCPKETSPERCRRHHMYNRQLSKGAHRFRSRKSPSFKGGGLDEAHANDDKLEIKYLSGKIEGDLITDTVHVGSLAVRNQVFGAAERIDVPLLDDVDWDGILGLAYPSSELSRRGVEPLFDTVMQEHLVSRNMFGYYLGPTGGMITLGGSDPRLIAAGHDFQWVPVVQKGYWTVGLMDVELVYPGGEVFATGVCKRQKLGYCPTIVDTGTYLIYGPRNIIGDKLKDIQTSGCSSVASLPKVVLVMYGGPGKPPVKITLTPEDYTLKFRLPAANVPASECAGAQRKTATVDDARCVPDCLTGLAPDDVEKELFTLGQVFLRNFYTAFDRGSDRMGFVRSVSPGITHGL